MTAQPASSHGRGEEFGKRRRASARRPEWDAGRELSYAACTKKGPSLGQDDLTMEPETTIRSSRRKVALLRRAVRTKGPGRNEKRRETTSVAKRNSSRARCDRAREAAQHWLRHTRCRGGRVVVEVEVMVEVMGVILGLVRVVFDGGDDKGGRWTRGQRQRVAATAVAVVVAAAVNDTKAQRTWDSDGDGDGDDDDDYDYEEGDGGGGRGQRQVKRRPISARQMGEQRAPKDGQRHQRASAASLVHAQPAQGWAGGPPDAQCGQTHAWPDASGRPRAGPCASRVIRVVTVVAGRGSRTVSIKQWRSLLPVARRPSPVARPPPRALPQPLQTANVAPVHGNRAAMSIPYPCAICICLVRPPQPALSRPGPCGWPSLGTLFRAACALLRSPPTTGLSPQRPWCSLRQACHEGLESDNLRPIAGLKDSGS
ncbi:hypothetical protein COCVIDRAFT_14329 [Bipolaris victoriae FI3]|uniref:Uncharacterized protein n=1 Tax=Bipolaris victoriae (strain FI3) TaxID=930091 RepID=W7EEF6_BIPV3|nr:hypothetical protein COCVIDRAFT_14329 [Bipolaris victoriae FI3]